MARILIVDDEYSTRTALRFLLEEAGFQADEASSANAAIQKLGVDAYDLATIDLRMPDTNGVMDLDSGIKLCKHIKENYPKLPVIVFTVRADEEAIQACNNIINVGDNYITKPPNIKEFINKINNALKVEMEG